MARDDDSALNLVRRLGGQASSASSPQRAAPHQPPGTSPTEDVRAAIVGSIEANKTRREVMDNKYLVLAAACIGAVAAIGGGLAVGMYQTSAEKERTRLELIRMAAQGNPAQAVRNLQFWNRVGLISLPVSTKDFAQAACDCLNECPAPLKRAACDAKPAN
jgi:hypothetical protein